MRIGTHAEGRGQLVHRDHVVLRAQPLLRVGQDGVALRRVADRQLLLQERLQLGVGQLVEAGALLDYVDLGFEIFGLRGYDLLADAVEFGENVIPLVRAGVDARAERAG